MDISKPRVSTFKNCPNLYILLNCENLCQNNTKQSYKIVKLLIFSEKKIEEQNIYQVRSVDVQM